MARVKTVWGIDIGQCALKALKLADFGDFLQVVDFEVIEHAEILSQAEAEKPLLIRQSLEQFLAGHNVSGSTIALAVPGQSSFTRFVKPPPVEPKDLPRIVQYEAAQQIPFPIDEVVWRWQPFMSDDSPDLEVGIFAMKRQDVGEVLSYLDDVGLYADVVQVAPLSLYNFMTYDEQLGSDGATLLADIGAEKTDLVVSDGPHIWTRTIQIGGDTFTEALARAFKLSFAKAEKLKRTAATSKYARQVFQAMRPVFADLAQEIQRSVGYYISLHREARFGKLLGLGNGFRLPGLQKFLEQNLNIPVARLDGLKNVSCDESVNVPNFEENTLSFGVAYGLALQCLRPTRVQTNLLPSEVERRRVWSKKVPWFIGSAVALLAALACPTLRAWMDSGAMPAEAAEPTALTEVHRVIKTLKKWQGDYNGLKNAGRAEEQQIAEYRAMYGYRSIWPAIHALTADSIRHITAVGETLDAQALLADYARAVTDADRQAIVKTLGAVERSARATIFVQTLQSQYADNLVIFADPPAGSPAQGKRGFMVFMVGRTTLPKEETIRRLEQLREYSSKRAEELPGISIVGCNITPMAAPGIDDPLLPVEDAKVTVSDTQFTIQWLIAIDGDGLDSMAGND